jgi:hypothetical protein
MSSTIRPTTIEDAPSIVEFLARIFSVDAGEPFLEPSLMRWKYWAPRGDCDTPRSYVVEKDGRIVAHVGLWPVTAPVSGSVERGVHMIDWAADPGAPGAGLSLLQRMTRTHDFVYSIGGSEMTRSILPKFGFRRAADALTWARPIRPLRQMRLHPARDLRLPARFARNFWWSKFPGRVIEPGWTAVESGGGSMGGSGAFASDRGEPFFRYLQECPAASCRAFDLLDSGRKAGCFALCVVREQARLAGVWLENPSPGNWRTAFHLAQDAARKEANASEFVARGSTEASAAGAGRAGMRFGLRTPVFFFRRNWDGGALPLQSQLADNDLFFRAERGIEFLT